MLKTVSGKRAAHQVIQPDKCIIEDFELLAFENEDQLNFFTVWHDALHDKRREANAESERERQIIRNEIARKRRHLIGSLSGSSRGGGASDKVSKTNGSDRPASKSASKPASGKLPPIKPIATTALSPKRPSATPLTSTPVQAANKKAVAAVVSLAAARSATRTTAPTRFAPTDAARSVHAASAGATSRRSDQQALGSTAKQSSSSISSSSATTTSANQRTALDSLPNGLAIFNSPHFNTTCNAKLILKYKLTKLYNKYRGRQLRRNFVIEKQRTEKIENEISKSYLNSWRAYTALSALRLPDSQVLGSHLTSIPVSNQSTILTPFTQLGSCATTSANIISSIGPNGTIGSPKHLAANNQSPTTTNPSKPAMHLVYIDPGNLITYSNRICPKQVADYRKKSHLLPSSATSKKSSAASYDVYEIMEVLANTNKTNVTITRNANRPSQTGTSTGSIYSHSTNANTPGIVSTQLHIQGKTYLETMSKFYEEEHVEIQNMKAQTFPSDEEFMGRYLNLDHSLGYNQPLNELNGQDNQRITKTCDSVASEATGSLNSSSTPESNEISMVEDRDQKDLMGEDDLEEIEDDIRTILGDNINGTTMHQSITASSQ